MKTLFLPNILSKSLLKLHFKLTNYRLYYIKIVKPNPKCLNYQIMSYGASIPDPMGVRQNGEKLDTGDHGNPIKNDCLPMCS